MSLKYEPASEPGRTAAAGSGAGTGYGPHGGPGLGGHRRVLGSLSRRNQPPLIPPGRQDAGSTLDVPYMAYPLGQVPLGQASCDSRWWPAFLRLA